MTTQQRNIREKCIIIKMNNSDFKTLERQKNVEES